MSRTLELLIIIFQISDNLYRTMRNEIVAEIVEKNYKFKVTHNLYQNDVWDYLDGNFEAKANFLAHIFNKAKKQEGKLKIN